MFESLKGNVLRKSTKLILFLYFLFLLPKLHSSELKKPDFNRSNILNHEKGTDILSEYLLGPGDILLIDFKGLDVYSGNYSINVEGFLSLPELDNFFAAGMTLNELKKELINKYQDYIINPDLNISFYRYRPISIYISGEVRKSGLYKINYAQSENVTRFSSINQDEINENIFISPKLFDAFIKAGGITNFADISKIQIIRKNSKSQGGGKIKTSVNLLSLIIDGEQSQNIRLFDGDYIFVPRSNNIIKEQVLAINKSNLNPDKITVYITGNVIKSGATQITNGSSLIQAIASTGGKKILTGNVEFIRFNSNGTKQKLVFRYEENAIINSRKNPILMDGDIINIKRTFLGKTAEVLGEISSPILSGYGLYSIFE